MAAALLVDFDVGRGSRLRFGDLGDLLDTESTLFHFRLPRVLGGALVGAALSGAGCAFQAALRNPLAEPYALGVSSGASLAAFIAITLGIDVTFLGQTGVGLAALAGAAVTVIVVWQLARVGSRAAACHLAPGRHHDRAVLLGRRRCWSSTWPASARCSA